ncbi:hypothetical protein BC827DRAFT_254759 [Russula dissimulans]|nr:hypothetical protein BC827DRAFT_254759 [Russula dissimulans]
MSNSRIRIVLKNLSVRFLRAMSSTSSLPTAPFPSSLPSQNPVVQAAAAPSQPFVCPRCERGFRRWQDKARHICTHLPHSYHCPLARCPWRSGRYENVTRHWNNTHPEYGPVPSRQQSQIFYSKGLVTAIIDGALTVDDAAEIALLVVAIKAVELDKGDVWQNGWGRRTMTGQ